jgi:ubiquinone/menaquinone biosynthesis C-methylase UbiE
MSAALETAALSSVPVQHPWDEAAEGWDRHSPMLRTWLHGVTQQMLDACHIRPGARVLDVAAGAGEQTLDIAARVGPAGGVVASDISPRILALAREKLQRAGFTRVTTQVADAEALPVAGAEFDAAVCRLGLMFCTRPQAALAGLHAALRPGGRLGVIVFSEPDRNPCITVLMDTARRHAGPAPLSSAPAGSLLSLGQPGLMARLLAEAGFVDIDVRPVAAPMHLPSRSTYIDFAKSAGQPVMALLAPLSAAAQAAAWHDIEQGLDRYGTPGGWVGPNELLLCTGTRPASWP